MWRDEEAKRITDEAIRDRYALILNWFDESFVRENLDLFSEHVTRVAGILVKKRTTSGKFYHACPREAVPGILANGFDVKENEWSTYGGEVVYTYKDLSHYKDLSNSSLLEIDYEGGYLESIVVYDKDDQEQGECLLCPDNIKSIKEVA